MDNQITAEDMPATSDPPGAQPDRSIESLVRRFHREVYRYAYRLAGSAADAEDLTQQAFLVAQQRLDQLRDADKADRWLFAIVRSCFLKSRRRQRPVAASAVDLEVEHIPDEVYADDLDRGLLQAAVNQLPDDWKIVVVMFYFEEASYKDIAAELEIPIGTVMSRLSRAKSRLRGLLIGNGFAGNDAAQPSRAAGQRGNQYEPTSVAAITN